MGISDTPLHLCAYSFFMHPVSVLSGSPLGPCVSRGWQQRGGAGCCWCWGSFSSTSASERRRDRHQLPVRSLFSWVQPGCLSGRLVALQTGEEGALCVRCMALRDAWDLRAAAAINVDCLPRWVEPFPLPRLPATATGRLGSAASPQIASVERGWWPWCSPRPSSSTACASARELQEAALLHLDASSPAGRPEKGGEERRLGLSIAPCMVPRCRREWMSSRSWPRDGCPQTGRPGTAASCG